MFADPEVSSWHINFLRVNILHAMLILGENSKKHHLGFQNGIENFGPKKP